MTRYQHSTVAATAAQAAAVGHIYVTNQLDDTLSVINARTNQVTATVAAGVAPEGVAVTPDGSRVYIADSGSAEVSVLDTANNKIVATVPVGKSPTGVALSPDGQFLYVANRSSDNALPPGE
jgi:YVTN family beta-propeller protein